MINNFILALNVVLPLFLLIALGYFLKCVSFFDDKSLKVINNLVFKIFLPVMLFMNIRNTKVEEVFSSKLLIYTVTAVLGMYILSHAVVLFEKDNKKRGALIQGLFRSNFVIFGMPVASALFGAAGEGTASLLVAFVVPMFNVLSVITLEVFGSKSIRPFKILLGIVKNPLIIASALGVLCLKYNIRFPSALNKTLDDLSKLATPLALIALGGGFTFSSIGGYVKNVTVGLFGRLIFFPALALFGAVLLGFRNEQLTVLLAVFASPAAVSSYTMAQQMNSDDKLAGQLVVLGTAMSVFTVFCWIFLLKQSGLI